MKTPYQPRVPGRDHYSLRYLSRGRVFSYGHQIETALAHHPRSVLEVGVGTGMVSTALRSLGITVTTVDVQPELRPSAIGTVTEMPFQRAAFDVAICCQVLEHLPFAEFEAALRELRRVTRVGMVLSLPDVTRFVALGLNTRRTGRLELELRLPSRSRVFDAQKGDRWDHFWEIGFAAYSLRRIKESIGATGWVVGRTWRVPELPWHRFFDCVPDQADRR